MDNFNLIHIGIFLIITFLWIFEIIRFRPEVSENQNKNSFYQILFSIISSIFITVTFFLFDVFSVSKALIPLFVNFGIILYSFGLFIRLWSRLELGKYFSHHVTVDSHQELISKGPYKYFRHPLYIGLFTLTIAVPIVLFNYGGLLYAIFTMKIALSKRVNEEEIEMERELGKRYLDWKKTRYKIF